MPSRLPTETRPKAAVSVSEMARQCELSRSHFNLLIQSGVMPQPLYSLHNRRPFYDRDLQESCLLVKATNTGIDGRYVVFYARRSVSSTPASATPSRPRANRQRPNVESDVHAELVDGLRSLGLTDATTIQVEAALRACYPTGHDAANEGEVLRELWRYLRRQIDGW